MEEGPGTHQVAEAVLGLGGQQAWRKMGPSWGAARSPVVERSIMSLTLVIMGDKGFPKHRGSKPEAG